MSSLSWLSTAIGNGAAVRELAAGDVLFTQGALASAMYAVEAGRMRLVRRTVDGHLAVLHTARANELFAEAALFSDVYHCDAVAAVPSRVRKYPKDQVLAGTNPDMA